MTQIGIRTLARIEWCLLIAYVISGELVGPAILLFLEPSLIGPSIISLIIALLFAGLIFVFGGTVFELAQRIYNSRARKLDIVTLHRTIGNRASSIAESGGDVDVYIVPNDFRVGAYVKGIFRPKIVLSGGAYVALARQTRVGDCIYFHERAHIEHWDRVLPIFVFGAILTIVSSAWVGVSVAMVTMPLLTLMICRRREYFADASAWIQLRAGYQNFLESAKEGSSLSPFHPTLSRRVDAATDGYKILSSDFAYRMCWFGILVINSWALVSVANEVDFVTQYWELEGIVFKSWLGGSIVSFVALTIAVWSEDFLARKPLKPKVLEPTFKPAEEAPPNVFLVWIAHHMFLVIGMISVAALADYFESIELLGLGGAVVFIVYRSLRSD